MWEQLQERLRDPWLGAAVIVIGSILAAYVASFVLRRTLGALARRTTNQLDDRIIKALHRPIFLSVIFIGLEWASETTPVPDDIHRVVSGVLATLAVVVWTVAGLRISNSLLHSFSDHAGKHALLQQRTLPVFDMLFKIAIIAAAMYCTFLAWRVDLTAWMASAGIVGIAIGFAAKDTLANLFAGIFIVADSPYQIGDFIVIDGNLRGQVTRIGLRSTRILTQDDVEITVPNSIIGSAKILNEVGGPTAAQRVRVKVSAAYGSDIDRVREVLLAVPAGVEHLTAREPQVRFRTFGDSGLDFELLVWIDEAALRGRVVDRLNCAVYKAFAAAGIEIPYSKHDVYIKQLPARAE